MAVAQRVALLLLDAGPSAPAGGEHVGARLPSQMGAEELACLRGVLCSIQSAAEASLEASAADTSVMMTQAQRQWPSLCATGTCVG